MNNLKAAPSVIGWSMSLILQLDAAGEFEEYIITPSKEGGPRYAFRQPYYAGDDSGFFYRIPSLGLRTLVAATRAAVIQGLLDYSPLIEKEISVVRGEPRVSLGEDRVVRERDVEMNDAVITIGHIDNAELTTLGLKMNKAILPLCSTKDLYAAYHQMEWRRGNRPAHQMLTQVNDLNKNCVPGFAPVFGEPSL